MRPAAAAPRAQGGSLLVQRQVGAWKSGCLAVLWRDVLPSTCSLPVVVLLRFVH